MASGNGAGTFPAGFLWGAATSGYQIEGAFEADGKGPSIWDRFVRQEGATLHGDTGDRACNAYDADVLGRDLDLMAELGLGAYIFSVQWARVQPEGTGELQAKGVDYYRRLVDGLLARGIVPALTLYHWELPQTLQDAGGWLARATAQRFADYAAQLHDVLGDRVPIWITQNEPYTSARLGHAEGKHAPGLRDADGAFVVAHHLLLSHGLATQALRAGRKAEGTQVIGPVLNLVPYRPADPRKASDRAAAVRRDGEQNRFFLDALFRGRYPDDVTRRLRARQGKAARERRFDTAVHDGDLATIATPLDVLGVNYYFDERVAGGRGGEPRTEPAPGDTTAMGWPIAPDGLRETLRRVRDDYTGTLPLLVSENGTSCRDTVDPEGRCRDPERIDFLRRHLHAARRAIDDDGVPLKGFFVWSLLDNFEWDHGYRERFGLVHVDYPTSRRTPKTSFDWYRRVIAANAVEPADE